MKTLLLTAVVALTLIAFLSCGLGVEPGGQTEELTIVIGNLINSRSIMPGLDLDADHYDLHGDGMDGAAAGASFDLTVDATTPTVAINLLPGNWDLTATAVNAADTDIGGGSDSVLIEIGTPATVTLDCFPFTGDGTFTMDLGWVPDILESPSVEVNLVDFGGTPTAVPMTLQSSVFADGTVDLEQGWYTLFTRILDSGEFSAGIVETSRIAAGATTAADYFLTVSQLEGGVTFDLTWTPYAELEVIADVAPGDLNLYLGDLFDINITSVDVDSGTSAIFVWYMNGSAVAIGTDPAFTIDIDDYEVGLSYYLSLICWQDDGARAGDAQWKILASDIALSQMNLEGMVAQPFAVAAAIDIEVLDASFAVQYSVTVPLPNDQAVPWNIDGLAPGTYYLRAVLTDQTYGKYYGGTGNSPPGSPNITIPHSPGATFDILALSPW